MTTVAVLAWVQWLFAGVLRATWQASVLILIVLAVQWALRRQLSSRWRYNLWLLVVARLMLPVTPPSPLSVFNLIRATPILHATHVNVGDVKSDIKVLPTPSAASPAPVRAVPTLDQPIAASRIKTIPPPPTGSGEL
jgi:beta-lactamase regulating signal transducer with metallopeptidase domain